MKFINLFKKSFSLPKSRYSFSSSKYFLDEKYLNFNITATDHLGSLEYIISMFANRGIGLSYARTHHGNITPNGRQTYTLQLSVYKISQNLINEIQDSLSQIGAEMESINTFIIPWFPRSLEELNQIGKVLLDVKDQVNKNSPQFTDPQYRKRRQFIAGIAKQYKMGDIIPDVQYTQQQTKLWCYIYAKLKGLHQHAMSNRFNKQIKKLQKTFKIDQRIPQLNELNNYLKKQTGFIIKPTHGILSQRQFLNAFAFRAFCCTQYIRHPSIPQYTPQPDIVHQIVGHIPMFADPDVAQLSHKIGLLSLGASDDQVAKLGSLYWFTLQFGVCKQGNQRLGYGAGIASSIGQIQNLLSDKCKFKKFEPLKDCSASYTIQDVQQVYRVTQSFKDSLKDLEQYGRYIMKSVTTTYNFLTNTIQYDRNIQGIFQKDQGPKF